MEYTHLPAVLNGWIFAWWGLYDYVKATNDITLYHQVLEQSCETLVQMLPQFTNSFWSMYDCGGHIASPHYQTIHVAQMQAMYSLTGRTDFADYAVRWQRFQQNPFNKYRAFFYKAYQKIIE